MPSIKDLKKDINYVLGDIIDECLSKDADPKKKEVIVDETITTFDELIARIHTKGIDNKKTHFKSISADLQSKAEGLLQRVNKL